MAVTEENLIGAITEASDVLRDFIGDDKPLLAVILGSGLNPYADTLKDARVLPFKDVPHMKISTAIGHKGQFVIGTDPRSHECVLCMQGRLHGYEGNSAIEVAFPIWVMHAAGIDTLLTTNAVGAINTQFEAGNFCVMADHINLTGRNPIAGVEQTKIAERFVPMKDAYDVRLRKMMVRAGMETNVTVYEGVYLGLLGPSFETAAEIRAFRILGADTVAMSVCEEVIAARHVGMRVCGCSLISNMATGVAGSSPNSDDIMELAEKAEASFSKLMGEFTTELAKEL